MDQQQAPSDDAMEGRHVMRFGPAETRRFSHVNRIIDVPHLAGAVDGEGRELRMTVAVRAARGTATAQRFKLRLAAFAEDVPGVREQWFSGGGLSERALSFASRAYDVTESGWVVMEVRTPLPPEARNVVISIAAGPVDEPLADVAYEADAVTLALLTTPAKRP